MEENSCSCSHLEPHDASEIRIMQDQIEYMKELLSRSGCQEPMYRRCMMRNNLREKLSKKQKSKKAEIQEQPQNSKNGSEDFDPTVAGTISRASSQGSRCSENGKKFGSNAAKNKSQKEILSFCMKTVLKINGEECGNTDDNDGQSEGHSDSVVVDRMENNFLKELRDEEEEEEESDFDEDDGVRYDYINDEVDFSETLIEYDNIESIVNTKFRSFLAAEDTSVFSRIKSTVAYSHMTQRYWMKATYLMMEDDAKTRFKEYMVAVEKRNQVEWQQINAYDRTAHILAEITAKLDRLKHRKKPENTEMTAKLDTSEVLINSENDQNVSKDKPGTGRNESTENVNDDEKTLAKNNNDEKDPICDAADRANESDKENTRFDENPSK